MLATSSWVTLCVSCCFLLLHAGVPKALPGGFQGLVLKPTGNAASNSTSDAQQRSWQAVGSFSELVLWGHDVAPAATDPHMRCIDWLALADKVGGGLGQSVWYWYDTRSQEEDHCTWQGIFLLQALAEPGGRHIAVAVVLSLLPLLPLLLLLLQIHGPVSTAEVDAELQQMRDEGLVS